MSRTVRLTKSAIARFKETAVDGLYFSLENGFQGDTFDSDDDLRELIADWTEGPLRPSCSLREDELKSGRYVLQLHQNAWVEFGGTHLKKGEVTGRLEADTQDDDNTGELVKIQITSAESPGDEYEGETFDTLEDLDKAMRQIAAAIFVRDPEAKWYCKLRVALTFAHVGVYEYRFDVHRVGYEKMHPAAVQIVRYLTNLLECEADWAKLSRDKRTKQELERLHTYRDVLKEKIDG